MNGETREIGKIESAWLGGGGYQEAMFGVSFHLSGKGWAVGDFWGTWATRSDEADYSEREWLDAHAKTMTRLAALMKDARCRDFRDLAGKPVEATFSGGRLVAWRILTEVL